MTLSIHLTPEQQDEYKALEAKAGELYEEFGSKVMEGAFAVVQKAIVLAVDAIDEDTVSAAETELYGDGDGFVREGVAELPDAAYYFARDLATASYMPLVVGKLLEEAVA